MRSVRVSSSARARRRIVGSTGACGASSVRVVPGVGDQRRRSCSAVAAPSVRRSPRRRRSASLAAGGQRRHRRGSPGGGRRVRGRGAAAGDATAAATAAATACSGVVFDRTPPAERRRSRSALAGAQRCRRGTPEWPFAPGREGTARGRRASWRTAPDAVAPVAADAFAPARGKQRAGVGVTIAASTSGAVCMARRPPAAPAVSYATTSARARREFGASVALARSTAPASSRCRQRPWSAHSTIVPLLRRARAARCTQHAVIDSASGPPTSTSPAARAAARRRRQLARLRAGPSRRRHLGRAHPQQSARAAHARERSAAGRRP